MRQNRTAPALVLALAAGIASSGAPISSARGADRFWIFQGDPTFETHFNGAFNSPSYWDGLVIPASGDSVYFGSGPGFPSFPPQNPTGANPHTVYFGNFNHHSFISSTQISYSAVAATVERLIVRNDEWTFDFASGVGGWSPSIPAPSQGSLTVHQETTLADAIGAPATLNIRSGVLSSQGVVHVAPVANASGLVDVAGPQARWNLGAWVDLGWSGKGTIRVRDAAQVTVAGSINAGIRDGAEGVLDISGGGHLLTQQNIGVGDGHETGAFGRASGSMKVTGSGSRLDAAILILGSTHSTGVATVDSGAEVHVSEVLYMGSPDDGIGTLTISGQDSLVDVAGDSRVGTGGSAQATVNVLGGARMKPGSQLTVGDGPDCSGTLVARGQGSVVDIAGGFAIAWFHSTASVEVSQGARLISGNLLSIGDNTGAKGELFIQDAGSRVEIAHNVSAGFYNGSAMIAITGGGILTSGGELYLGDSGVDSLGHLAVSGPGSLADIAAGAHVGRAYGNGSVDVSAGGEFRAGTGLGIGDGSYGPGAIGRLTITGAGSTATTTGSVGAGVWDSQGTIEVAGGGTFSSGGELYLGDSGANSIGIVRATGAGTLFQVTGKIHNGRAGGNGTIEVTNGAHLAAGNYFDIADGSYNPASVGSLSVADPGSKVDVNLGVSVAYAGSKGTIQVSNGAELAIGPVFTLGEGSGSVGTLLVTGANALVQTSMGGTTSVGKNLGSGTIDITSGGHVRSGLNFYVGFATGSVGAVNATGAGSVIDTAVDGAVSAGVSGGQGSFDITNGALLQVDNALNIGLSGAGTLSVSQEGQVHSQFGRIGRLTASSGTATIKDSGSRWDVTSTLFVGGHTATGPGGVGTLFVNSGAWVTAATSLITWSQGKVDVSAGGKVRVGSASLVPQPAGSVIVTSGGTLGGDGLIIGDVILNGGTLSPGHSPGRLTISGSFTAASSSTTAMEIGGTGPGTHDQVDLLSAPQVSFGGTLQLSFVNGYAPHQGDVVHLFLNGPSSVVVGTFDHVVLPEGYQASMSYGSGSISVILGRTCPADMNSDNVVDDADFSLFVVPYNILDCADPAMPVGCAADLNGDAFVDDADFVIFVAGYNEVLCP